MNFIPDAQAMLEALCVGADPRKVRSLRLIHTICVEQHDRGSDDYSIATIGRLSAERGGPAAGAIRNKPGETYRALIRIFAGSTDAKATVPSSSRAAQIDRVLEGVSDPVLRTRLGLLLAELKSTRAQLLAARHLANRNATLDLGRPLPEELPSPSPLQPLTPLEARALEIAVSPETLNHWGWRTDETGRITTDTGRTVFPAGFVAAIRKALASLHPDQDARTTLDRLSSSTTVAPD